MDNIPIPQNLFSVVQSGGDFSVAETDHTGFDSPEDSSGGDNSSRVATKQALLTCDPPYLLQEKGKDIDVSAVLYDYGTRQKLTGRQIELRYRNRLLARKTVDSAGRASFRIRVRELGLDEFRFRVRANDYTLANPTLISSGYSPQAVAVSLDRKGRTYREFDGVIDVEYKYQLTQNQVPLDGASVQIIKTESAYPGGGSGTRSGPGGAANLYVTGTPRDKNARFRAGVVVSDSAGRYRLQGAVVFEDAFRR